MLHNHSGITSCSCDFVINRNYRYLCNTFLLTSYSIDIYLSLQHLSLLYFLSYLNLVSNTYAYISHSDLLYINIMASGPITAWEIDGERVETVSDFIFGGSKITADGHCSHEIKRRLLLGRKVMTNLDSILKSRDYFANEGSSSQGYGFSTGHVWM